MFCHDPVPFIYYQRLSTAEQYKNHELLGSDQLFTWFGGVRYNPSLDFTDEIHESLGGVLREIANMFEQAYDISTLVSTRHSVDVELSSLNKLLDKKSQDYSMWAGVHERHIRQTLFKKLYEINIHQALLAKDKKTDPISNFVAKTPRTRHVYYQQLLAESFNARGVRSLIDTLQRVLLSFSSGEATVSTVLLTEEHPEKIFSHAHVKMYSGEYC